MSDRARDSEDRAIPDVTHLTSKLKRDDLDRTDAPESSESPTIPPPQGEAPSPGEAPTIPPKVGVESEGETLAPSAPAAVSATMAEVRIPGYEIIRELGRGGMGVVYQARQTRLGRVVALKMILSGAHAGPDDLARFRTEAEAVARLQHPGIVQIFEVGEHNGLPFFSLEFCPGGALDGKLNGTPMQPNDAAALVQKLAEAMSAAHEQSVIHRDLKPANVLLDANGSPKITDFGLAKKLDEASQTQSGSVMGTPSYMAPEQAGGRRDRIGPGADVYALGAILYDCLTGRPPFRAATAMDTVLQVLGKEPVPPGELQPKVPKDLETICLKCLSKEPHKRYVTTADLAEDLRRFRAHEPIRARPVSRAERAWRWCRRNPAVAGLLTLVMVVLLSGVVISSYFAIQSQRNADRAGERAEQLAEQMKITEKALARANFVNYAFKIDAARRMARQGDFVGARDILKTTEQSLRGWEHDFVYRQTMPKRLMEGHSANILCVAISPDGKRIVSGGGGKAPTFLGEMKVWDTVTGKEVMALKGHTKYVKSVAFSPGGKRIVSGSGDRTVRVWDATTGELLRTIEHSSPVNSVAFSPDGKRIVSGGGEPFRPGGLKVWDASTGEELLKLAKHSSRVFGVAFSPDGKRIASGYEDKTIKTWDATSGDEIFTLKGHTSAVNCVAFTPDSTRIVSGAGGSPSEGKVWDASTGEELFTLRGHVDQVLSVAPSPDGTKIVTGGRDWKIRLWDARTGKEIRTLTGHTGSVASVGFSPDGKHIFSGSRDGTLRVWDVGDRDEAQTLVANSGINYLTYGSDGKRIVIGSGKGALRVWDARPGDEARTWKRNWGVSMAFSPDGKRIVTGGGTGDHTVKVWDALTGKPIRTLRGHTGVVKCVAFSPDGKRIVSGSHDKTVRVWDALTGRPIRTLTEHTSIVNNVAFSPDGKRVVSCSNDITGRTVRAARVWDAVTGEVVLTLKGHPGDTVDIVTFSPDGKRIAGGGAQWDLKTRTRSSTIRVWDAVTGDEVITLKGHTKSIGSFAFSPDGKRIVSSSSENVKVWDTATGLEVLTFKERVARVTFSPDGKRIVGTTNNFVVLKGVDLVKIWDASLGD